MHTFGALLKRGQTVAIDKVDHGMKRYGTSHRASISMPWRKRAQPVAVREL
ncbi:hypothetical protein K239x_23310 [Planctomycetes bacterium K23_9]|uniref:Uncharacterized protein n=1 Tax=Stieleria marina TaxID=1930275 RepID=A0A517NTD3_9BACT|nr:hypothetical protein K239x_23310 [Planctomycetes bacterium K23_9]